MPKAMPDVERIAVAVVERGGCYLIGQRARDVPQGGLWEFPGGKIEAGESPEEAAVRECLEEAGVVVEPIGSHGVVAHDNGVDSASRSLEIHFIACRLVRSADTPMPTHRWVAASALRDYPFPAANGALIDRLSEGKQAARS